MEQSGGEPASVARSETLGSLGEAAVLARIFPRLPAAASALLGPGDDAAVLAAPDGRYVVTTDTMVHGPDFRLAWSTPFELGWKAAATNLSDIAAMGARPTGLVVAIVAPSETPAATLEGIADGLREACAELAPGTGVVGGDLSVSDTLVIAVTAFGDLEGRAPVLRSGARAGDIVAVSGALGLAAQGIALLFAHAVDADGHPDAGRVAALRHAHGAELAAQLTPRPPLADGVRAALAGATAMLDVSDGLALDARRLAAASGVLIDLDGVAIGIAGLALEGDHDEVGAEQVLRGGEDHALLATFPPGTELPGDFRPIGHVRAVDSPGVAGVLVDGVPYEARGGWDPYADWNGGSG
ncbi:thiamine-phosphate kinase [Lysinimonas soli]|uniref:Thiamine-monophosphate kinase n=1 Tax=Lysinimonas soli TaxID=1074233 RepID=A0ABW0NSX0_9MICO